MIPILLVYTRTSEIYVHVSILATLLATLRYSFKDLFNLFGCLLEPATHSKHEQVETFTKVRQVEKASDAEQSIEFDNSNRGTGLGSPIPLSARPQRISTGRELFYQ
ncbi:hypothetical protein E2542_SST12642 [Spatholobus suberectus]|nr:hypothetical protein E2542_SST12642 [Spatholobus suberectus]